MVVADERATIEIFDPFELEAPFSKELASIGNSFLDRREFEKIILAFAWAIKKQQHEPDGLQRLPSPQKCLPRQLAMERATNLSRFAPARNGVSKEMAKAWIFRRSDAENVRVLSGDGSSNL